MPGVLASRLGLGPRVRLAAVLALGQAAGRGGLAIALLILVRGLTAEEFGDLALALAVVGILATVADAGFGRLIVRDVARTARDPTGVVLELLRARLPAVLVVVVSAGVMLALLPAPFSRDVAALGMAYLICEALAFGFENAAVGAERPWRFVVAQGLAAVALLGGTVGLAWTGTASLSRAMAVLAAASTLKVCAHAVLWRSKPDGGRVAISRDRIMQLYREALPFLGLALLATVYYRIGVVALYAVQGSRETASYAAAMRVVDVVAMAAGVTFSAISPALSRAHRDSPERIWLSWKRAVARCAVVVLPLVVIGALAAPLMSRVLFGAAYEQTAGEDLRLLMPGIALMVLQVFSAAVVFMADDHRDVLRLTAFNVGACVLLSVALSFAFGSAGLTIPLVPSRRPVGRIVFLCALVASPGLSFVQQREAEPEMVLPRYEAGLGKPDEQGRTRCVDFEVAREAFYADCDKTEARAAFDRLRPQARTGYSQPCALDALPDVPMTYVMCEDDAMVNPAWSRRAAKERLAVDPVTLPGSHSPFLSRPAELAEVLHTL